MYLFSVLVATENESAESFDPNVTVNCLLLRGQGSRFRIVFEKFKRREE